MRKVYHADPKIEVAGSAAKSMINNIVTSDIETLIAKHGLDRVQTTDWVRLNTLCQLFNDITEFHEGSSAQIFVAMGMKIAEQSEFPPEMLSGLTLPMILMGWNDHYWMNHRGGTLPEIVSRKISEHEYELRMVGEEHPYPYNMTYGMVYGFCRTLLPKHTKFHIWYEDNYSPYTTWHNGVILRTSWV